MDTVAEACLISLPSKSKEKGTDTLSVLNKEPWYSCFKELWNSLEEKLKKIQEEMSEKLLNDIVGFIRSMRNTPATRIPILTLLTGVNLPDHELLFHLVAKEIEESVDCRIASIQVTRETSTKQLIENIVYKFMFRADVEGCLDDEDEDVGCKKKYKKAQCTFLELRCWYEEFAQNSEDGKPYLVVIIPEIETISLNTLHGFLDLMSGCTTDDIPFVLIFGVATTKTVINKKLLSYRPKFFDCHIFKSQPTVQFLDNVLNQVFLTPDCPIKLHGRVFQFLTDNFLYYNFSVNQFICAVQLCIINHFTESEINMLCCPYAKIPTMVKSLSENQMSLLFKLKSVGELNSYRKKENKPVLEKTPNVKKEIVGLLEDFHKRFARFHLAVRCLHAVSNSMNDAPLGTHIRQVYSAAMLADITKGKEYKDCCCRIQFMAKVQLLEQITTIQEILTENSEDDEIAQVLEKLNEFRKRLGTPELQTSGDNPRTLNTSPDKNLRVKDVAASPRKSLRPSLSQNPDVINGISANSPSPLKVPNYCSSPGKRCGDTNDMLPSPVKTPRKLDLASSPVRRSPRKPNNVSETPPSSLKKPDVSLSAKKKLEFNSSPNSNPSKSESSVTPIKNRETGSSLFNGKEEDTSKMDSPYIAHLKKTPSIASPCGRSPRRTDLILSRVPNNACQREKSTVANSVEKDYAEFLTKQFFGPCLVSPTRYPFNEIFIYSDVNSIKQSLDAVPRGVLYHAMHNPQLVLSCTCCELKTTGDIPDTMPDLALAFNLLKEAAGTEVNMHDWLQMFDCKANGGNYDEHDVSPEIYARFMQAVRDLKFMGYILPSKRKNDHVIRARM